jgi:hypothetical protein
MRNTVSKHRTALIDALLDLLDFIEERIQEAIDDPATRLAAITEAGCAIPLLRDRLREDDEKWASFLLLMGCKLEARYWREWWEELAKMEPERFLDEARTIFKEISLLRKLLTSTSS